MSERSWLDDYRSNLMGTVTSPQALLTRGEGCYVWDVDGKRYLDFLAGIAVNALGHAHPVLVQAVTHQISTLAHVSNYFASPPQIELAQRLLRLSGAGSAGRVFFGNSGAEAMEAAFKLARLNGNAGQRPRVLTLKGSFHGRTMGALSLTGQDALQQPFRPLVPGVEHIDVTVDALRHAMGPDVAALIVEPIQGEAGVLDLPKGFLRAARELTTEHGALLILDEIQTGAGRTGEWFAFQHHGIVPDAIAVAKGIAGGVPIGALITFGVTSALFQAGQHGSTFGGNPLSAAAGNAVLGELESASLVTHAKECGSELRSRILAIDSPLISAVRGQGLLLGIALDAPVAKQLSTAALELGLIVNAANESTIRIAPPLIIGEAEVAEFIRLFTEALNATNALAATTMETSS